MLLADHDTNIMSMDENLSPRFEYGCIWSSCFLEMNVEIFFYAMYTAFLNISIFQSKIS